MKSFHIAGWMWTIGAIIFVIANLMFEFAYRGSMEPGAAKTAHLVENWMLVSWIWRFELSGILMMTGAAAFFAIKNKSLSWVVVTIGHFLLLVMYPFMLSGYPVAAKVFDINPALFNSFNEIALSFFSIGNIVLMSGLAGVILRSEILPSWVSKTMGIMAIFNIVVFTGTLAGLITFDQVMILGPVAITFYLFLAWFGYRMTHSPAQETAMQSM